MVKLHIRGQETRAAYAGRYSTRTMPHFFGQDLSCGGAKQPHWSCSPCITHSHARPLCRHPHSLCTAPPPREIQSDDLTLDTLRTLTARNFRAHDAGDSPEVDWLDVLSNEDPVTPPRHPPWRAQTLGLPVEGVDPTIYVLDYEQ